MMEYVIVQTIEKDTMILYSRGRQSVAHGLHSAHIAILCGLRLQFIISIKTWNTTLCLLIKTGTVKPIAVDIDDVKSCL